ENKVKSRKNTDSFVSIGEKLSSVLMQAAIKKLDSDSMLIDARDIIKTDSHFSRANPNLELTREACEAIILPNLKTDKILITQGYIGSSPSGETTTLGRGGSDYTAALIAEAIGADLLQIWTDVSGIATTDPRIAPQAKHIKEMTFQEAAELATAGAKILYPKTIIPSRRANIPVYVGNTSDPESRGTVIRKDVSDKPLVRAIALKTDQRLITITTLEMAQQFGFLAKLFEIFARYKVSIDQISTSEISVAVTMDSITLSTDNLLLELQELGRVSIEEDISVVSLIGNDVSRAPGLATKIFSSLETKDSKIAIRMICQGASKHSFCFLVADHYGKESVKRLHKEFVEKE
ncbi:MAG TPA: aspartate kinase, partial [Patescibacteria group bacterium]|nr:aspartate kinase [Patescibacteria group bacterium]